MVAGESCIMSRDDGAGGGAVVREGREGGSKDMKHLFLPLC